MHLAELIVSHPCTDLDRFQTHIEIPDCRRSEVSEVNELNNMFPASIINDHRQSI